MSFDYFDMPFLWNSVLFIIHIYYAMRGNLSQDLKYRAFLYTSFLPSLTFSIITQSGRHRWLLFLLFQEMYCHSRQVGYHAGPWCSTIYKNCNIKLPPTLWKKNLFHNILKPFWYRMICPTFSSKSEDLLLLQFTWM